MIEVAAFLLCGAAMLDDMERRRNHLNAVMNGVLLFSGICIIGAAYNILSDISHHRKEQLALEEEARQRKRKQRDNLIPLLWVINSEKTPSEALQVLIQYPCTGEKFTAVWNACMANDLSYKTMLLDYMCSDEYLNTNH